jgi:glycosyltransferase involved in cell wall biosynthesis
LEIILVDDGSTDASPEKCDCYAKKDPRIRVIHKKNGGQSSARNVGLDVCKGEYISFVDSDDWIEPNMYTALLEQLEFHGASLAVCGRYDAYENSDEKTVGKSLGKSGLFDAYEVLPKMTLGQASDFSVCDKLHHRDLWQNIRFPEGEIYEDFAVMYKILIAAKKVVLCDVPFYVYFHRKNSTVTSGFREALTDYPKQTKQFLSYIPIQTRNCSHPQEAEQDPTD